MIKKFLLAFILLYAGKNFAANITVASIAELQNAITQAKPGDVIQLVDGVYTTNANITITSIGTKEKPITITAKNPWAAEITGTGGFSIEKPAAHIIIKGFKFTHAASAAKSGGGTSFCRWTENIFETPGDGDYLVLAGNDLQVDHNSFQNKKTMGKFIAVKGVGSQIAERLWIHHNYFKVHTSQGGKNGAEAFQFGLSGFSLSSSNSIVEHNLFEDCEGENELISVKASRVILRYNTIRNCKAQFTLRHGNFCQVYGNYFINTPGLRIFGDDHVIHSNHFENCSIAINIGNGGAEVADGAPLVSHDRPDRVLIAFNTMVNNVTNIVQTPRKEGIGATHITVANNLIQGGGPVATISGPFTDGKWLGNIIFNTKGAGDMPTGSYTEGDTKLAKDATGSFHLQKGSIAIDASTGEFSTIKFDMDGQERKGRADVGADELSNEKVNARVLHPEDVGHRSGGKL